MQNYNVHTYVISMEFLAVNRRRPSCETPLGPGEKKDGCFCRLITGLHSGEDTDVGGQHVDLSSPHKPVAWLSLCQAHAANEYS